MGKPWGTHPLLDECWSTELGDVSARRQRRGEPVRQDRADRSSGTVRRSMSCGSRRRSPRSPGELRPVPEMRAHDLPCSHWRARPGCGAPREGCPTTTSNGSRATRRRSGPSCVWIGGTGRGPAAGAQAGARPAGAAPGVAHHAPLAGGALRHPARAGHGPPRRERAPAVAAGPAGQLRELSTPHQGMRTSECACTR